jgi:hypothetical protein
VQTFLQSAVIAQISAKVEIIPTNLSNFLNEVFPDVSIVWVENDDPVRGDDILAL